MKAMGVLLVVVLLWLYEVYLVNQVSTKEVLQGKQPLLVAEHLFYAPAGYSRWALPSAGVIPV